MQTAHGLLLLKLLDLVAAGSDVDGDEDYQALRTEVGVYVVENRVPSAKELSSFDERVQSVLSEYTDAPTRFEDPATHVAPAGLKSDLLRTAGPATTGGRAASAFRDPYATENIDTATSEQVAKREALADKEEGVAYVDGQNVKTPSEVTAASLNPEGLTGSAVVQGEGADGETNTRENAEDYLNGEDGDTDETDGVDDGIDGEPDFDSGTVADLKQYLDANDVSYPSSAKRDDLIKIAKDWYADQQKAAE